MQFFDLEAQQQNLKDHIDSAICDVLAHGQYILGPEVALLESKLEAFTGAAHCTSCGNGTDALQIALMALGVGAGDEVIVPGFTYIAPAEAVAIIGATPVYVDIESDTYNIDHTKIESLISKNTKAIIAVSLFGQCPDFDAINEIASQHGLSVIEDAAQSFGATYKDHRSCNLSTIATTSFFPTKPLGCYGDGGAIFCNNDELASSIRKIARHGQTQRYHHEVIGLNSRLDTIQASILLAKLSIFENELVLRNEIASRYINLLKDSKLKSIPVVNKFNKSVWAQFTIEVESRDEVRAYLKGKNIPTAVYYPTPLHKQPAVQCNTSNLPISEEVSKYVLSLPMGPYLTEDNQDKIVQEIKSIVPYKPV